VGTVAGVVGALAAAAVFVFPPGDSHSPAQSPSASTQPGFTDRPTLTKTSPISTAAGAAREIRLLADLTPVIGADQITVTGHDIAIRCPSNQSDDTYQEFAYSLPSTYRELSTNVTVTGSADQDAIAGVQVFGQQRQDRSDRLIELGRSIVKAGETHQLGAQLGTAVAVTFRVSCVSPNQTVHLIAPRITR
jgi:hypothetical protein